MDCRLHTFDSIFGSITIVRFPTFDTLAVQPRDHAFWYIIILVIKVHPECTTKNEQI